MDQERDPDGPNVIEGADAGALGTGAPPESAPPGARVDGAAERVPGSDFDEPSRAEKPWSSSLAAESPQAGVGNEPHEGEEDPVQDPPGD